MSTCMDLAKVIPKKNCIALNIYVKKEESAQINEPC